MRRKGNGRVVAFGVSSKRFENLGMHPSLERRGYCYKYPKISPGCYYSERGSRRKTNGIGYSLSRDSEEFSRTLGHRVDDKLKMRNWIKSINGPGWHDVKFDRSAKFGTFANACRFPVPRAMGTPGPGIYGKEHIPHTRLEEKSKAKAFSFSDTPSFEYDNCMPRTAAVHRSYHLPPNMYKVKTSIEELIAKITSKRGPYDLFTGARDETSLYGHLAVTGTKSNDRASDTPSGVEELNNRCNRYKGKFLKCGRDTYPAMRHVLTDPALCKPDLTRPGPNTYDPRSPRKPAHVSDFPFDSSVLYARPMVKIEFKAPPGRYDVQPLKGIIGDGMRSAFLSKTKRGLPIPEKMSWF